MKTKITKKELEKGTYKIKVVCKNCKRKGTQDIFISRITIKMWKCPFCGNEQ